MNLKDFESEFIVAPPFGLQFVQTGFYLFAGDRLPNLDDHPQVLVKVSLGLVVLLLQVSKLVLHFQEGVSLLKQIGVFDFDLFNPLVQSVNLVFMMSDFLFVLLDYPVVALNLIISQSTTLVQSLLQVLYLELSLLDFLLQKRNLALLIYYCAFLASQLLL